MSRFTIAALAGLMLAVGSRAEEKGTVVEIDGLKSKAPAAWRPQEPASRERVAQFDLPRAEGDKYDGQLIVFYFGPGSGGGAQANIERWKTMVDPAEGTKPEDAYKTSELKVGDVKVTVFEANGTYKHKRRPFDPNEQPEMRADYRMVGVIMETPNGPYYMRMFGPKKTMDAHRKGFEEWLKNFK